MPIQLTRRRSLRISLACAASALFSLSTQAYAQQSPESPGSSAVDQYVEAVPTASSPAVPGVTKETRGGLSPAAERALEQAAPSTAIALEQVATSSTYGAPRNRTTRSASEPDIAPSSSSVGTALRSTANAIGTTSDLRLLGLLAVVLITTAATAAVAVRRARSALAVARSEPSAADK